jgi:hypothetical protein
VSAAFTSLQKVEAKDESRTHEAGGTRVALVVHSSSAGGSDAGRPSFTCGSTELVLKSCASVVNDRRRLGHEQARAIAESREDMRGCG